MGGASAVEGRSRSDVREALPLRQRAQLAMGILGLVIVIDLLAVFADLEQLSAANRLIAGERVPFAELDSIDGHVAQTGLAQLVSLVVAAVAFLLWFSRAYRNAIAMGIRNPRFGTRWAVGCWFVPFVNLVLPKQVTNDIYRGSDPEMAYGDPRFEQRRVSPLIHWWWGAWIVDNILGRIAATAIDANSAADFASQSKLFIASDLLDVVTAVLAILVIRTITDRNEARRSRWELNLAGASMGDDPPPAGGMPGSVTPAS